MSETNTSPVVPGAIRGTVYKSTKEELLPIANLLLGLLQAIRGVRAPQKIVLLDQGTVKVIDAVISMPEILDEEVFLIENISLGRQPYPEMAAVYIVRATPETVDAIIRDFTPPTRKLASGRTGPMYGEAHLFFTTEIPSGLMGQLARSPVAPWVRSLQELHIDFVAVESRAFHLGIKAEQWARVWSPLIASGPEPVQLGVELDEMATKLISACITMGEVPRIRYRNAGGDVRSSRFALRVHRQLEETAARLGFRQSRSTLLIVDRTVDLLAPLLREFTLQALATDVLDLGPDGTRYNYSYATIGGGSQSKVVSLDERDGLWIELRHAHIADCSSLIIERFNNFLSENKAAVKSRRGIGGSEEVASLGELKDTMAAMTEFQVSKGEYGRYLSLAQECLSIVERKKLIETAGVEQDMVTGLDASGEPVKDSWNQLAPFLARPELGSRDKARLLLLYLLTQPRLSDAERRSLFDCAQLDAKDLDSVRKLLTLADNQISRQRQPNKLKGSKRKSVVNETARYDVSRYIPALKVIMEDIAYNELDTNEFPYVQGEPGGSKSGDAAAPGVAKVAPTSLRTKTTSAAVAGRDGSGTPPVFVFVLGGMTRSEMRSTYEMSASMQRDFYIGSDCILTPSSFFELLGRK